MPSLWSFPLLVLLLALATGPCQAGTTLAPINDNQGPPYFGVTKGGPMTGATDEFAAWLNRSTIFGGSTLSFGTGSDWESLAWTQPWFYAPASSWMQEGNGRLLAVSVMMLPGPTDDSGPTTGPGAGSPVSLATGAAGKYNSYFYALGQQLVANNLANCILRLGWEFNGNWYAWSVLSAADATNFAAYWKQIVNTLRTVPGQNFKFNWGGSITYVGPTPAYQLSQAFPAGNDANGKPYVDQVGLDIYDNSWTYYPWPANSTPAQILVTQQTVWNNVINTSNQYWGIPVWTAIAKANHIPFTIPEWGVSTDIHAGGDNTYYIQQMHDFIQDPTNNVYYASYYDAEESQISPNGGFVTTLTNSAALYQKLFTIQATAPATLSATGANASAVLTWTGSPGATGYALQRSTTPGGPYVNVGPAVNALTYTDSGLSNLTTYYYVVAAINAGGQGANSTEVSVTPTSTPTSFNAWSKSEFTAAQLADPSVSGLTADPAGDGLNNLMKYALGLDPKMAAVTNLSPQVTGDHLGMTYRCVTDPSDLHCIPQISDDLVNWTPVTPVVTVPDGGTGMETVKATDPASASSNARRFMRLLITSP